MSIYLVDFENVTSEGLGGVSQLTSEDRVILFYSNKANKLSMNVHMEICRSEASFEYKEVTVGGKNALDFQLSTYLGYLIGQGEDEKFFIISKDKGYQHLTDFWQGTLNAEKAPIRVENVASIKVASHMQASEIKEKENETVATDEENIEVEVVRPTHRKLQLVEKQSVPLESTQEIKTLESVDLESNREEVKSQIILKDKLELTLESQPAAAKIEEVQAQDDEVMTKAEQIRLKEEKLKAIKERAAKAKQNRRRMANKNNIKGRRNLAPEEEIKILIKADLEVEKLNQIVECFKMAKNRQDLYCKIVKVVGQEQGSDIYRKIKTLVGKEQAV